MNRQLDWFIGTIIIAVALILSSWVIREALAQAPGTPVIAYRFATVTPSKSALCPGQELIYRQQADVRIAPSTVRVVASIWSFNEDRTIVPDDNPRFFNYTVPTVVFMIGSYLIPDLSAGAYELRVSSTAEARQSAIFTVPFMVPAEC